MRTRCHLSSNTSGCDRTRLNTVIASVQMLRSRGFPVQTHPECVCVCVILFPQTITKVLLQYCALLSKSFPSYCEKEKIVSTLIISDLEGDQKHSLLSGLIFQLLLLPTSVSLLSLLFSPFASFIFPSSPPFYFLFCSVSRRLPSFSSLFDSFDFSFFT